MICLTDGRTDRHETSRRERTTNGMTFTLGRFDRRHLPILPFRFADRPRERRRIASRKAANHESKGGGDSRVMIDLPPR